MGPRGGVGAGVLDFSSGSSPLDLGSCGGHGLGEMAMRLREGCSLVADGDGHEFHLSPHCFEGGDELGVLSGLLLKPLVASKGVWSMDYTHPMHG